MPNETEVIEQEQEQDTETSCCESCNREFPTEDLTETARGDMVCSNCLRRYYFACEDCMDIAPRGSRVVTGSGRSICQACYESNYFTCEVCGEVLHMDYYHGDGVCDGCHDNEPEDSPDTGDWKIEDYGYKPRPRFYGSPKRGMWYGLELETENTRDLLCDLDTMPEWYAKHDGSLDESGVEFVSHPMTLDYIRENWDRVMKPLCDLRSRGARSWNGGRCGFHIHVSESAWSHLQVVKLLKFFANNPAYILQVSGRSSMESLHRWASIEIDRDPDNGVLYGLAYKAKHKGDCDKYGFNRYVAINLCNRRTIEFRLFRGSLIEDRIKACLEFVQALCDFTLDSPITFTVADFQSFVRNNRKSYPAFCSFHKLTDPETEGVDA